jgi:hypothetical protein
VIGSAIPRIGSSNALGYDTSTGCRLSRLDHLIKRFPHLCRFGLTLAGFPVGAGAAGWHHARPAARAAVRRRGRIHPVSRGQHHVVFQPLDFIARLGSTLEAHLQHRHRDL